MKTPGALTIVIKLGTSSIVHERTHEPRLSTLSVIVETAVKLRQDGHRVVIVSSGAIGVALQMMNLETRPKNLPQVQALAALGQCRLMSIWDGFFMHLRQPVAQILLTRNDIADRTQYLNAQNTLNELLNMGVIPIVNENDTLSVAEIKFGDNDTLSAITAAMLSADYLFLMTDVDCLYTSNPRSDANATPIEVVNDVSVLEADVSSSGSDLGTGGMSTKIVAAKLATSAGVITVITQSSKPGNVAEIVAHCEALRKPESPESVPVAPLHTRFLPTPERIRDRSFWLMYGLAPHGTIYIDEGAYRALKDKAGLLPVGVVDVEGIFSQQEAVRLVVVRRRSITMNLISSSDSLPTDDGKDSPSNGSKPGSRSSLARGGIAVYESLSSFDAPPPTTPQVASEDLLGPHTPSISTSGEPSLLVPIAESVEALTTPAPDSFERKDPAPREVGRALVNYAATEVARIKGMQSRDIPLILGYADSDYVALRENVSLFSDNFITTASVPMERSMSETKMGDLGSFA